MFEAIKWLQNWYTNACNGDWEHSYGVSIDTIDNPGWRLKIDLSDTVHENISMVRWRYDNPSNEDDWIHCWLENNVFHGACGPKNLSDLIKKFKSVVEEQD